MTGPKVKWVKGFEHSYSISEDGVLVSYQRSNEGRKMTWVNNGNGYLYCMLKKNNKYKTVHQHRLVAEAFVPNPDKLRFVLNKNGIKKDISLDNLVWSTAKERVKRSKKTNKIRRVGKYSLDNKLIKVYDSILAAQRSTGSLNSNNIGSCLRTRESKIAYGYIWKYMPKEV